MGLYFLSLSKALNPKNWLFARGTNKMIEMEKAMTTLLERVMMGTEQLLSYYQRPKFAKYDPDNPRYEIIENYGQVEPLRGKMLLFESVGKVLESSGKSFIGYF